jgi:hypothetical protein
VDVRVRTFVAEASGRLEAVLEGLGFVGPEVVGEGGAFPLVMTVRYHRVDVAVRSRLILAYGGEEYVDTSLLWADGDSGGIRRVEVGEDSAHTGYQMRRALGRHAQAVSEILRQGRGA